MRHVDKMLVLDAGRVKQLRLGRRRLQAMRVPPQAQAMARRRREHA